MNRWIPAVVLALFSIFASAETPDPQTIIARSVEANHANWKAADQFACFDKERTDEGTDTHLVLMIEGSPYHVLVAENGQPLDPEDRKAEQTKLRQAAAQRRNESEAARARRIAKYENDQRRNHALMGELSKAFNFRLLKTQNLDGREVYVLAATPRPGYQPSNRNTEVLKGMQGKMWIDTKDFQWVKVEAEAVRPVSIEGFLARVEPGTRFELEVAPVAPGLWLPKHFSMRARAKILYLFPLKQQGEDTYFGCHRQGPLDDEARLAETWKPETAAK